MIGVTGIASEDPKNLSAEVFDRVVWVLCMRFRVYFGGGPGGVGAGCKFAIGGLQDFRPNIGNLHVWTRSTHWGNIRVMLGLYGDNGKGNANYSNGLYRF